MLRTMSYHSNTEKQHLLSEFFTHIFTVFLIVTRFGQICIMNITEDKYLAAWDFCIDKWHFNVNLVRSNFFTLKQILCRRSGAPFQAFVIRCLPFLVDE